MNKTILTTLAILSLSGSLFGQGNTSAVKVEPSGRVWLNADQSQALTTLLSVRPAKPVPLFLFTDPNKDPDDLSVLIETKYLQVNGFVDLRCALTTLGDREVRTT